MQKVKEIEQRVHLLSGVLASPVSEDDHAEKGRRVELQRFVPLQVYVNLITHIAYPICRKLETVIAKLEPLSEQHVLVGFLCNVNNSKTLTGFVQELANAIMDYQV